MTWKIASIHIEKKPVSYALAGQVVGIRFKQKFELQLEGDIFVNEQEKAETVQRFKAMVVFFKTDARIK